MSGKSTPASRSSVTFSPFSHTIEFDNTHFKPLNLASPTVLKTKESPLLDRRTPLIFREIRVILLDIDVDKSDPQQILLMLKSLALKLESAKNIVLDKIDKAEKEGLHEQIIEELEPLLAKSNDLLLQISAIREIAMKKIATLSPPKPFLTKDYRRPSSCPELFREKPKQGESPSTTARSKSAHFDFSFSLQTLSISESSEEPPLERAPSSRPTFKQELKPSWELEALQEEED